MERGDVQAEEMAARSGLLCYWSREEKGPVWLGFSARSIAKGLTEVREISKDQITRGFMD